ncbi:MAG: glucose 1-dehydrogenase, partial [Anaerolineae bacterium]|nr:glucose 1-dehydrogenase [Anaerolineae bacterium]
ERATQVCEEIKAAGGSAVAVVGDVAQIDVASALTDKTVETYGRVDVLVNNAATNPHFGPMLEAEDSLWQKTIEVNIMGNIWLCQQVVPVMREHGGGSIINVASVNGIRPGTMQGIYSMTKAAVISLTKTLAMELGVDGIRVNAIAPGLIQTKFAQVLWENEALLNSVQDRTPLGRIGQPEDIASLALWLASDASSFATGETYVVDGGLTLPAL